MSTKSIDFEASTTVIAQLDDTFEPSVVVAVMVQLPAPMAATSPVALTVATASSEVVHSRAGLLVPAGSTVASSCEVLPMLSVSSVALSVTLSAFTTCERSNTGRI